MKENSDWVFRFAVGRRLVTVAVPPYFVVALLAVATLGYGLGSQHAGARLHGKSQRVAYLETQNQELKRSLESDQAERAELEALAETRFEELSEEIADRDREMVRLWSLVGRPTLTEVHQRTTMASRSGKRPEGKGDLSARYRSLAERLTDGRSELGELSKQARSFHRKQQAELAKRTPNRVPCAGEMTSGFGKRLHPVYGYGKQHNGCDFTAPYGTPIYATASGTVKSADWLGGYGQAVEIEHVHGIKTLYAHCETLKVKKGQKVRKGQLIATVGTTGLSSGPHCHYEVHKDGKPINPAAFLPAGTIKPDKLDNF